MPMISTELSPIGTGLTPRLETVHTRIQKKMRDFATYRFSAPESCAINIFLDLAQEFDDIEQLHLLSVLILHMFFTYDAELYIKDEKDSVSLVTPAIRPRSASPELRSKVWSDDSCWYIPVYGKNAAFLTRNELLPDQTPPLGFLALHVNRPLESHELLFLNKYANRVGFSLDSKLLALRNERHVLFLRKLAHDIGHNIITPNLRLMLMLNQLESQVKSLGDLAQAKPDEALLHDIRVLQHTMDAHTKGIIGTFKNSAMFMESLLRQSHFDLGHYVLRPTRLNLGKRVVAPQFERFRPLFEERGLLVDAEQPQLLPEAPPVEADLGLISQVLANLLSNASKYSTPAVPDGTAEVRCTLELIADAIGEGQAGLKVSVYSSGPNIPSAEAALLFDDNYRASNSAGQYGTGHGLFFVREIITAHKGSVGYTPAAEGNIFYFILPVAG